MVLFEDLYAAYPIVSAIVPRCNYYDNHGNICVNGKLEGKDPDTGEIKIVGRCPECERGSLVGAGSFIKVDPPSMENGEVDLRNPVTVTPVDGVALQYNAEEVARIETAIWESVTGHGGKATNEAINTTQVKANFESKSSVLLALKGNLERAQAFVLETICRLRYGERFLSLSVNWGTEFYLYSVEELYNLYEVCKRNGCSEAELTAISKQIQEVEYKNNSVTLRRMQVLRQLEPYEHKTTAEVMELFDKGIIDVQTVRLKLNFSSLIDRFERENMNVVEFGSGISLAKKIEIIQTKLIEYVTDTTPTD